MRERVACVAAQMCFPFLIYITFVVTWHAAVHAGVHVNNYNIDVYLFYVCIGTVVSGFVVPFAHCTAITNATGYKPWNDCNRAVMQIPLPPHWNTAYLTSSVPLNAQYHISKVWLGTQDVK